MSDHEDKEGNPRIDAIRSGDFFLAVVKSMVTISYFGKKKKKKEKKKGAASALYGADAMTGVINIITKKNVKKTTAKVSFESGFVGAEGHQNHSISFLSPKLNLGFHYSHLDGIREISRSFSDNYQYDTSGTDKYSFNLNTHLCPNFFFDYLGSFYQTGFKKIYDDRERPSEGTDQEHYKHFVDLRYENEKVKLKVFDSYGEMKRDD